MIAVEIVLMRELHNLLRGNLVHSKLEIEQTLL